MVKVRVLGELRQATSLSHRPAVTAENCWGRLKEYSNGQVKYTAWTKNITFCPVISAKDMVNSILISPCGKFPQRKVVCGIRIHTTIQMSPTRGFKWSDTDVKVSPQPHFCAPAHKETHQSSKDSCQYVLWRALCSLFLICLFWVILAGE